MSGQDSTLYNEFEKYTFEITATSTRGCALTAPVTTVQVISHILGDIYIYIYIYNFSFFHQICCYNKNIQRRILHIYCPENAVENSVRFVHIITSLSTHRPLENVAAILNYSFSNLYQ